MSSKRGPGGSPGAFSLTSQAKAEFLAYCETVGLTEVDIINRMGVSGARYDRLMRSTDLTLSTIERLAAAADVQVRVVFDPVANMPLEERRAKFEKELMALLRKFNIVDKEA